MRSPIFGSSYVSRSQNLADNLQVNCYAELVETKQGKEVGALYGTPGLDLIATAGSGPIYAMFVTLGNLYVVSGTTLYSISPGYVVANLGSIPTAGGTTGAGYVYTPGGGVATVALPYAATGPANVAMTAIGGSSPQLGIFTAISATQQDGFGLINQPGTYNWWQSNLLDLRTWGALNFAQASGDPDNIICVRQKDREVFIIKEYDTEIWVNAGTAGFAFQRLDGTFIEAGIAAVDSLAKAGDSFICLARNKQGQAVVIEIDGYKVSTISTEAQTTLFQTFSTISDARAYCYQQQGHTFYVLTFPTANQTWAYDKTTSQLIGAPIWHQRGSFSGGVLNRHLGNAYALFNGLPMVGDYQSGNIYALNPATLTDNSAAIQRVRSWRAVPKPTDNPTRFSNLRIDMQTGLSIPAGTNPTMVLDWSDDGGHTYSNPRYLTVGLNGEVAKRVFATRLGSTRRNSGLDRIFRISTTDAFPWAIIGAELS